MMQVTVKTLDSQTKTFSVSDEATVRGFKQQIEQELEIATDRQKLIFKGKVLQDEKKLKEYGVDGCVVHLVQKVPHSDSHSRTRDTSTPTTTGATTGPGGGGNFVMGAFTVPIDVMGVTQQIVQSLVNQLGVDSAQANISTTQSDDGAALNVHINLHATSQPGSDVGQRLSRARNFLRSAKESLNRTEGEGMLSGPAAMDTGGTHEAEQSVPPTSGPDSGRGSHDPRPSHSPLNLADILREVQQISASLQPALDRYATLLSSNSTTELQPSDDSLPDRIAETLHNLSHSYHALSDLTFNFRSQEPRYVQVLPPLSPHSASLPVGILPPRRAPAATQPASGTQTRVAANGQSEQQSSSEAAARPTITLSVNPQGGISFTSMSTIRRAMTSAPPASASQTGPTTSSATTTSTLPRNIFAPDFISHTSSASTGTTNSTTNRQAAGPNARFVVDDIIAMISGSAGPVLSPQTSAASASSSSSSSPSTSSSGSQQQSQSAPPNGQPVHLGPSALNANHPDPSVPCQSFHFGPQARSTIPSQETNRPAASVPSTPAAVPSTSAPVPPPARPTRFQRHTPTAEELILQVRDSFAAAGVELPEETMPGQTQDGTENNPNHPHHVNQEHLTDSDVPDWLRFVTRAAMGNLPTMEHEERRRQAEARERRRANLDNELRAERQRAQRAQSSDSAFSDMLRGMMTQMQSPSDSAVPARERETGQRSQTLAEMIRNTDSSSQFDEPDEEGDLISPLFRRLSNFLTVPDLMEILSGSHEPFRRLRPELMMYVRVDLLRGGEPTDDNLKRASEQLVQQIVEQIHPGFGDVPVKDGIDLKASLISFVTFYIENAVNLIAISENNPNFGEQFSCMLQDMSSEFLTLLVMCLRDGINGLQEIVETRMSLSVVTQDLDPAMQQVFAQVLLSHVRQMYERTRYAEPRLQRHVIRSIRASEGTAATQPDEAVNQTSTSQASAPKSATSQQRDEVSSETSEQSDDFATPPGSIVAQEPDDAMETEEPDVDEDWKAVMPEEWVPIITRDIVHQRRMRNQAPFSDAYLAGVPPKRRKMIDQRGLVATEEVLPEALKRAASAAGVSPRTSVEDFAVAVGEDNELHQAYQKEIEREVQTRLETDSDYKPEQFPNAREYFDRKSNSK